MICIKAYSELNTSALRLKRDRELAIWYLVRYIDRPGCGLVPEDALQQFVTTHDLFSVKTLGRWLRKGEGQFWQCNAGFIAYRSLFKVADLLGVRLRRRPVMLDLDSWRGVARLRAVFMASFFAEKGRMMSRTALGKLIGRSAQTTRNYAKTAGLAATANAMLSARKASDYCKELEAEGYYRTTITEPVQFGETTYMPGQTYLAKRLPNTYSATHDLAAFGQVRHHRRETSFSTRGAIERLYFTNATAAAKALHRTDTDSPVYYSLQATDVLGSALWQGMAMIHELGVVVTC